MNSTIIVTEATLEHLDEIAELFDMYRTFYKQEPSISGAKDFLRERFIHRESVIFVARDLKSEVTIGFTQLYPTFSSVSMQRSWILNDLFVREEYRGIGAGKLLLDKAKRYAVQTGSKGLSLETAIDNKNAQSLYEKEGFVKDTSYYHYYCQV